jgi:hypothetical protein
MVVLPAGPVRVTVALAARGGAAIASPTLAAHKVGSSLAPVILRTHSRFLLIAVS